MDPETVTIGKAAYEQLLKDSAWLACLEEAGVDNWQGICEAYGLSKQYEAEGAKAAKLT